MYQAGGEISKHLLYSGIEIVFWILDLMLV